MTHESSASLISLGLSPHFQGEDSSIRWWLAGSLTVHAILIFILTTLRFTPMFEQPLHSYEVSLINLSEVKTPPTKAKVRTKVRKSRPKPAPKPTPRPKARPPAPKAQVLPPLPTQTASERLSESFSGAVQSVVVPNKLSAPTPTAAEPMTSASPPSENPNILENIRLPSAAPQLARPKRLEPQPQVSIPKQAIEPPPVPQKASPAQPAPTPPNVRQETQKALQAIKAPPKAPTLKPIQPFKAAKRKEILDPSVENLSDALKEKIQSVKVPTPRTKASVKRRPTRSKTELPVRPPSQTPATPEAPQLAQIAPTQEDSKVPETKQERLSDSLKQVLDTVKIPKLRQVPLAESPQKDRRTPKSQSSPVPDPRAQQNVTRTKKLKTEIDQQLAKLKIPKVVPSSPRQRLEPDTSQSEKLKTEIDQQLAKLKIPDVAPIESLKKRLQVQVVTASEPTDSSSSSSPASNTSRHSPGRNRYLALIEAKIEQKWVAPRVSIPENHPQVILKFRILRSGKVMNLGIEQGSGNGFYDAAAKRAVKAASPLPPFPKDLKSSYLDLLYKFRIGESTS